jgi:hypothetical protein
MARTVSILLGMGLAALALVGCSKNNIAGPQALQTTAAESGGSSDATDENNWKGKIYLDRPVPAPIEGGWVYVEGRPVPAPIEGGRVYVDGRPVAAPSGLIVNETDF